jgi:hypothetical protein
MQASGRLRKNASTRSSNAWQMRLTWLGTTRRESSLGSLLATGGLRGTPGDPVAQREAQSRESLTAGPLLDAIR